jgi:hypothetical protein
MRIDGLGYQPDIGARPGPAQRPERPAPDLRAVLTADELSYFAELERLGPVTYGRRGGPEATPPAALGQRVDVKA